MPKWLILMVIFVVAGCGASTGSSKGSLAGGAMDNQLKHEPTQALLEVLAEGSTAANVESEVRILQSLAELDAFLKQVGHNSLTLNKRPDFKNHTWIAIVSEPKPNPGYRIGLKTAQARMDKSTLYVPVQDVEPDPGFMYAQVISTPYLLVKIEQGGFDNVETSH